MPEASDILRDADTGQAVADQPQVGPTLSLLFKGPPERVVASIWQTTDYWVVSRTPFTIGVRHEAIEAVIAEMLLNLNNLGAEAVMAHFGQRPSPFWAIRYADDAIGETRGSA